MCRVFISAAVNDGVFINVLESDRPVFINGPDVVQGDL